MAAPSAPEDGRTYHTTQSKYVLPNDSAEHRRLEATASILRELFDNKNFHAPLDPHSTHKIVDIGCGTGLTTHELGATFPNVKVYGVDLSPVPPLRTKLENTEYIQGDVYDLMGTDTDERLQNGSFDYVFSRALMGGITDWERYVKLCVSLAKPGAWIEMQEPDFTASLEPPPSGDAYEVYSHTPSLDELEAETASVGEIPESWRAAYNDLLRSRGLEPRIGDRLGRYFKNAGLESVHVKRYVLPFGTWEGMTDVQRRFAPIHKAFVRDDAPGSIRKLGSGADWSSEEVDDAVERTRAFVEGFEGNREFGWYYVVYGRKAWAEHA